MTSSCEDEARQFDQRSSTRSAELSAIGQAMAQLKSGVASNYGSNALAAGASFLQLKPSSSDAQVISQAASTMKEDATRLHSSTLLGMSLKLSMGGNHFGKVVDLVKNMITKLEAEAKAAAATKSNCDEEAKKSAAKRDKSKLDMESLGATIAMKTADNVKRSGEIQKLSEEIADVQKSVLERSELRSEEAANNLATLSDAEEGKKAVNTAITVLNGFYTSLLQKSQKASRVAKISLAASPKNRHGQSVKESPMEALGDYGGKTEASKGIIGILEVVLADFARTLTNVKNEEQTSAADHADFMKQTTIDVAAKNKLINEKKDDTKTATADITKAKDNKLGAESLLNIAVEELEEVTAMCLTGEGTFAERKKQREDEIAALKVTVTTLTNWKEF